MKVSHAIKILTIFLTIIILYFGVIDYLIKHQKGKSIPNRQVIEFRIDSHFSTRELALIKHAFENWNIVSGNLVKLTGRVVDIPFSEIRNWRADQQPTIYDASSFMYWQYHIMSLLGNHNLHLGMTLLECGDIFIMDKEPSLLFSVVAHEIGHVVIGDYHSTNKKDLMYYKLMGPRNITANDIEALKKSIEHPELFGIPDNSSPIYCGE